MSAKEIVPAIVVDEVRSLTVDSNVLEFVAINTSTGLWVKLGKTDMTEVCAVREPKATCCWVEQHAWVNGIIVLIAVRSDNLYWF